MLELLKYDFFQNALISTLLIGISCGLVGTYIVAKRMVFISGGITHASFGGLGLSYYLGLSPMLGATAFSILSALGILFLSDSKKLKEDSLIGIFWSAGMAIGILFIYLTPGYAPQSDVVSLREYPDRYPGTDYPFRGSMSGYHPFFRPFLPSVILHRFR